MTGLKKKYLIKIPENLTVVYSSKKSLITVIGRSHKKKSMKLKVKITISNGFILVSEKPALRMSYYDRKDTNSIRGTTTALIKRLLIEVSSLFNHQLKIVGVGYRVLSAEGWEQLLQFRLGFSHKIYLKIPNKITISCLKFTKLFVLGDSYQNVTQMAAVIRQLKPPEPYKGKGILHNSEKIKLKVGKKV